MDALKAVSVCRAYGRQKVLDGFSLTLAPGEFAALMGPSGSGKSTFLHVAAGLLSADSGVCEVAGADMVKMSDRAATVFRRRQIGVVFQAFNLVETLTVRENVVLPLRLDRRRADEAEVTALLARLGLADQARKYPHELSGGECQRVAIARALIVKPALLLADEPTGNLDVAAARDFCALLREVSASAACAILLVTHDPVVAAAADRVHFLKEGRLAATVETRHSPAEISARYLETYG
jgi:putative ABC transport system ATP-binding protein